MLREITTSNRLDQGLSKRWFNDEFMDLIVWQDESGSFAKFQLCYDKIHNEHALTWVRAKGFVHNAIDDGEDYAGGHKSTPILVPDGQIDLDAVIAKFKQGATAIDEEVIDFVSEKLLSFQSPE